jgi:hypothetical protein
MGRVADCVRCVCVFHDPPETDSGARNIQQGLIHRSLLAMPLDRPRGILRRMLRIVSGAFQEGGEIPTKHTCEGEDLSPALQWSSVPEGTQSLALIVDDPDAPDPDAPKLTWVHWVLFNLPPDRRCSVRGATPGHMRRYQRLEAHRLGRPVSAYRASSVLLPALRARLPTGGLGNADANGARPRHGKSRACRSDPDGHVPEEARMTSHCGVRALPTSARSNVAGSGQAPTTDLRYQTT